MAQSIPPPTPSTPRRSTRHQPTATPSVTLNDKNILECRWSSPPLYSRPLDLRLDIMPEQMEEWEATLGEGKAEDDEDDDEKAGTGERERQDALRTQFTTTFYSSFRMKRKATTFCGMKTLKVGRTETQTYRVGDPVMVKTDTLLSVPRPPSVGVIVALWETRKVGDEGGSGATDPANMRIRVHWFVRPSEMASVRAMREHEENEVYYCLSSKSILTPSVIITRCAVSRRKLSEIDFPSSKKAGKKASGPGRVLDTPSKRTTATARGRKLSDSPLKRSTRFSPSPSVSSSSDSEDDGDKDQAPDGNEAPPCDPDRTFYCVLATHPRRCEFFKFDWETHRKRAVAKAQPPASTAEADDPGMDVDLGANADDAGNVKTIAGPSSRAPPVQSHREKPWRAGDEWNVIEVGDKYTRSNALEDEVALLEDEERALLAQLESVRNRKRKAMDKLEDARKPARKVSRRGRQLRWSS